MQSALNMLKLVETVLTFRPADPSQNDYHRALVLPNRALASELSLALTKLTSNRRRAASNLVYRPEVPSPQNINSAAGVYYEVGSTTDYDQLGRLHLFAQLAKVPIFSTVGRVPSLSLKARLTASFPDSSAPKKHSATSSARPSGASTSVKASA